MLWRVVVISIIVAVQMSLQASGNIERCSPDEGPVLR